MSRRRFMPLMAWTAAASLSTLAAAAAARPPAILPIAEIHANGERLLGEKLEGTTAGSVFKGIPFAAPPVGRLRWAGPRPHRPRPGPQSARQFAPGCYQDDYNAAWYGRVMRAFGSDGIFVNPPFSEDCLYLNVWTPDQRAPADLPVMVWIHGGANLSGWSHEPNYLAQRLATRGHVVVVSIAYRLGVFGFLSHPELSAGPAPANFGLLDQLAALRWVRANIAAFGGDARNVTVFGESAGAADIGYLLTSPAATGLFQRAISQSGGYFLREQATLASAQAAGERLARRFSTSASLRTLRGRASAEVWSAAKSALAGYHYGPVIDGRTVTAAPADFFREHGVAADLLIGSNEHEWYMYVDGQEEGLQAALAELPESVRDPLRERGAREPDLRHAHARITSLVEMGCPVYPLAAAAARTGHHAWAYRFTRVRPGPGGQALLSYHGAEIPYVFDSHDAWFSADEIEPQLTAAMLGYWSQFARSGDPNGADLPAWPPYGAAGGKVQELGSHIGPIDPPDAALCERVAAALYPTPPSR